MDKQEFFDKISAYATKRGLVCEQKDKQFRASDWSVFVSKAQHTEAIHVKRLKNGLYRFWYHSIYPSGRQCVAGWGYASGAYNDASLDKICKWFMSNLDRSI